MKLIRSLLTLTFTLTLSASDVLLRTAADQNATVIGRIPQTHQAFKSGTVVSDNRQTGIGWYQTTVKTSYKGYVLTDELGKNFSVQPGTLVRVDPAQDAPELTTCEENDRIVVSGFSDDRAWATVRFNKAVTVYYLISELPDTVAIDTPGPQRTSRLKSNKPAVNISPDSLEPETAVWIPSNQPIDYTPPTAPTELVVKTPAGPGSIMVESGNGQSTKANEHSSDAVIRNLVGTLQRERGSEPTHYPLRLYKDNKRIAYVDMSGIFISDLRPYLDQEVLIQGEIQALGSESTESVIHARSIQLSN